MRFLRASEVFGSHVKNSRGSAPITRKTTGIRANSPQMGDRFFTA